MDAAYLDLMYMFFGGAHAPWLYYLEVFVRIFILFFFTIIAVHYLYQKDIMEFSSTELIILLSFGTTIGDAVLYRNVPLAHSIIAMACTIFAARLISYITSKSKRIEEFVIGKPKLIIKEGKIIEEALQKLNLSRRQLFFMLRLQGIKHTGEVEYALFEANGRLSIIRNEKPQQEGVSTIEYNNK